MNFEGERWQRYYPGCQCSRESAGVELVRVQDTLGRISPVFRCCTCGRAAGSRPIKRGMVEPKLISAAPLIQSSYKTEDLVECELCGEAPAQIHHWAPRALFGWMEADDWPQSWLCQRCHAYWHKVVTPGLKTATDLRCGRCGAVAAMRRPSCRGDEAPRCLDCANGTTDDLEIAGTTEGGRT